MGRRGREQQRDPPGSCFPAKPKPRRVWARVHARPWCVGVGPAGAPLYVHPASVWVRQGRGWGEGRYFCPTASVSGGGKAPEEAASRSLAGPHPSSGVALRTWGRESPLFFGTGGQEMGLSPWGRWALPGVLRTVREGLSCFPFRRPLEMSGLGGRLWPLSLPMGSWLGSGSGLWVGGLWAASACLPGGC